MSEENKDYFGLNSEEEIKPAADSNLNEESPAKTEKKAKVSFTVPQVVLIVVVAVIAVLAIVLTSVSFVTDVNPISYISGEIHQSKLVNKWQSQDAPGLSAYEFFDDGTYKSYISTFSFNGNYTVQGDRLTLENPNSGQSVVYKYAIHGNTLTITLIEENGTEFSDRDPLKFDRVDMFNQKSFQDMLDELQEQTTEPTSEEAATE
jgi:hypothetical protein